MLHDAGCSVLLSSTRAQPSLPSTDCAQARSQGSELTEEDISEARPSTSKRKKARRGANYESITTLDDNAPSITHNQSQSRKAGRQKKLSDAPDAHSLQRHLQLVGTDDGSRWRIEHMGWLSHMVSVSIL